MSNVLKGYFISVKEDQRVVDSNELACRLVKEEEERLSKLKAIEAAGYDEGEFFEGLPAENIDALLDENAEGTGRMLKSSPLDEEIAQRQAELEALNEELTRLQGEADSILEAARHEAEAIKEQASQEGHEAGFKAGYDEGIGQAEELKEEARQLSLKLQSEYEQKSAELEPMLVDTLTDIYEQVFKVKLDDMKDIVITLLVDAINSSGEARNLIVHISKEDYPAIVDAKESILSELGLSEGGIEFIQDGTLAKAGCLIETDSGVFDCSLDTELKELKQKLYLLSRRF